MAPKFIKVKLYFYKDLKIKVMPDQNNMRAYKKFRRPCK